jgi:hypothetical protein
VQGLASDRIQTIVRARGENTLVSTRIEVALEEESMIMSARDFDSSGYSVPYRNIVENINRPPVRRNERETSRGFPGSRDRNSCKVFHNFRRGVGGNVTVEVGIAEYKMRCYATCGGLGQCDRDCKRRSKIWKASGSEGNEARVQKCSHPASRC